MFLVTHVFLEQPWVGEAPAAAAAGVRPLPGVDLHVELDVRELAETGPADPALVGFVSGVDQQVLGVVGPHPEGLPAVAAGVRLLPGVLQLVQLQRLLHDEAFPARAAAEGPLAGVHAPVVVQGGLVVEGLPAPVAAEALGAAVAELVPAQGAGAGEALAAGLAAERRQVHGGAVPPVDHPAGRGLRWSLAPVAGRVSGTPVAVVRLLVLLQVAVVQEGFPAQVTHEGLGGPVDQHVDFEFVLNEALSAHLANERPLTCQTHGAWSKCTANA